MAGRKWKKRIGSGVKSFRRPRGSRTPAKAILIVTEGAVTEPVYFHALKARLALATVEIVIVAEGKGDPKRLAAAALEQRKARRNEAKRGNFALSKAPDFDELWIVFDTEDPVQHGRFADGLAFAQANGVKSAHSTPCFEFWLLLHFAYTTAPMSRCADVIKPHLQKHFGGAYEKDAKAAAELIPPLVENLQTAKGHATRVREHHLGAGAEPPGNPSTEVDRLIDAIQDAASPANQ